MARKADKLRPYRVDYFDILEMKKDRALVRSVVVRAVTAQEARDRVLHGIGEDAPPTPGVLGRIIIRSHRYYKNAPTKEVLKPVEDLFTVNKAVEVMEVVEKFRKTLLIDEQFKAAAGKMPADPLAVPANTVVPDPPCGTAEIASRNKYEDPDVLPRPINLPDMPHFDLDAAAPILTAPTAIAIEDSPATVHGLGGPWLSRESAPETVHGLGFPDKPIVPTQPAVFDGVCKDPDCSVPQIYGEHIHGRDETLFPAVLSPANEPFPGPMPLLLKLALFCGVGLAAILIVLAILLKTH